MMGVNELAQPLNNISNEMSSLTSELLAMTLFASFLSQQNTQTHCMLLRRTSYLITQTSDMFHQALLLATARATLALIKKTLACFL